MGSRETWAPPFYSDPVIGFSFFLIWQFTLPSDKTVHPQTICYFRQLSNTNTFEDYALVKVNILLWIRIVIQRKVTKGMCIFYYISIVYLLTNKLN